MGSPVGILGIALPANSPELALERLWDKTRIASDSIHEVRETSFGTLPARLSAFMRGEKVDFPDAIDRRDWTDFRSRIWEATRSIPHGETRSYAWVAAMAGQPRAYRATGQALHHNPVPIIVPCHRVIGSAGSLIGFGGGLDLKSSLLALESGSTADSASLK